MNGTTSDSTIYGSSLIYSKFRPHKGSLLMFIPGASITSLPLPLASSPRFLPHLYASCGFHVAASALLLGA